MFLTPFFVPYIILSVVTYSVLFFATIVQLRNAVLSLLYSTDVSLLTVDGCNNYKVLSEADRAQGHIVINASNHRCDRYDLVSGWYRFQGAAGDRMADKCVPENHCGSRSPGWLFGAHPSIAEGVVTRRVCFSSPYTCCNWQKNIRIRNCGAYFVYELPRPFYCPLRYCSNGSASKFPSSPP